jgi:alpha-galactosidase/6-phospho-beta-glucosidase family protein
MAIEQFTKVCTKCGERKPLTGFPRMQGKHRPRCKPCHSSDQKEWIRSHPEYHQYCLKKLRDRTANKPKRTKQTREEKLAKKRAYNKIWSERNKERFEQMRKDWIARNKHIEMERVRRRQASKKKATPTWADKARMAEFYFQATKKTLETGVKWTVDHIVPLTSEIVCGLHCEANLQIMNFSENVRKGNRWWPDMP